MHELVTIILSSDPNKRMNSSVTAVTQRACGNPLLTYVVNAAAQAGSEPLVMVSETLADQVRAFDLNCTICTFGAKQLITGNSIHWIQDILKDKKGTVLILYGDTPLITGNTLQDAYEYHHTNNNQVTLLTSYLDNPFGYDRIIRDCQNNVTAISEHTGTPSDQKEIHEVNSGIVFLNIDSILMVLSQLGNTNSDEGVSLKAIILQMILKGYKVDSYAVKNPQEIMAVKDKSQLNEAEHILLKRIVGRHMQNGVTFHLPETCMIDEGVLIGKDTVIHPGTILEGQTIIGENCEIGPNSRIVDGIVSDNVIFTNSVMTQSQVGNNTKVGPFAYIRPGSKIGQNIKIGDFVEIKNSSIDDGTKVPHLSYVGDADVGKGVNIGCGAVFVNYDGRKKHRTTVGDHVFVGCNVNLVSPVVIKDYSYIAAGSTITEEVPEYALAIARSRQSVIENWVKKKGLDKK